MENEKIREIEEVEKKDYVAPKLEKAQQLKDVTEGGSVASGAEPA
jgi:hypothetical protein